MIPFNRPALSGRELLYIRQAVANGHLSGDGPFSKKCAEYLTTKLGAHKVLLTTSCTHALEMCALLLNIEPGDEVIVPSFAFVTTVNAFVLRGARPVFIDIRPDTLNLDETAIGAHVTPRTKAIVALHYAGVACEMDEIVRISGECDVPLVEDNALGLFAAYKGRSLGTFGCLATQSFHETKNVICGEGGALLINDERLIERAEIIREKGTNRSRFFRGEIDKYTWVDLGSSYLPSDVLAAFLYAQLEHSHQIQETRAHLWHRYYDELTDWAAEAGVRLPYVPPHCSQSYSMFYLLLPDLETRQRFIQHLRAHEISAVFHYPPLHLSEMGSRYQDSPSDYPVTEEVSARLVRLPFFNTLSMSEQDSVITAVRGFSTKV